MPDFFTNISLDVALISALFTGMGILHFVFPRPFEKVMPDYIPHHKALVFWSGVAELAGGIGFLFAFSRVPAAWGLELLLIAVFPANIDMFVKSFRKKKQSSRTLLLLLRLPLQFLLMYWVFMAANLSFN